MDVESPVPMNESVNRPGCVTAYALLLWLSAAAYVVGALLAGFLSIAEPGRPAIISVLFLLTCGLLAGAIPTIVGIGLWRMRAWGWWLVMTFQGLGFAFLLMMTCGALAVSDASRDGLTILSMIAGMAISGGILYWFYQNRALFGVGVAAVDAAGQPRPQSRESTAIYIIVAGSVAVLCVVPIVIIAVLTLIGPQIGEVFSGIIEGLGSG